LSVELECGSACKSIALKYSCEKERKLVIGLLNELLYFTSFISGGLSKVKFSLLIWASAVTFGVGLTTWAPLVSPGVQESWQSSVKLTETFHGWWKTVWLSSGAALTTLWVELQGLIFHTTSRRTSWHTVHRCTKTVRENLFKH